MGYAARLSPEAKQADYLAALRRKARCLRTSADLEGYLALCPVAERESLRALLAPLCVFDERIQPALSAPPKSMRGARPPWPEFNMPAFSEFSETHIRPLARVILASGEARRG